MAYNWIFEILKWLIVLLYVSFLGYPVCFRFLRFLPSRGFSFSLPVGFIIIGYLYWILCSLGLISNDSGGIITVLVFGTAFSAYYWKKYLQEIRSWNRLNWHFSLGNGSLFLISFALIVLFRLADPNISGTEKPMEMTFINGILRSESFPPHDSWLSGYGISYYYFGYILTALLIKLSGVAAESGFNLMLATVYAMAAIGALCVVNDLLEFRHSGLTEKVKIRFGSFFSPLFVLVAGNLEGFFEMLYAKGLFWNPDGTSGFWNWINLKELTTPPASLSSWNPTFRPGIWWWRASRVLSDLGLDGSTKEIIDEFPFFSFFLGDLHPHVLGIPFVILAVAIALNVYLQLLQQKADDPFWGIQFAEIHSLKLKFFPFRFLHNADFWILSLCLGALIFMNTWDFPFYFFLFLIAVFWAYFRYNGWNRKTIQVFLGTAVFSGIACVFLYGIFLIGLSSQAGGVIPSGVFSTRTIHLLIMFGSFFLILFAWLFYAVRRQDWKSIFKSFQFAVIGFLCLFLLESLIFGILVLLKNIGQIWQGSSNSSLSAIGSAMVLTGSSYAAVQGFTGVESPIIQFFIRRMQTLPSMIILFGAVGCMLAVLFGLRKKIKETEQAFDINQNLHPGGVNPMDAFGCLVLLIAFGLIILPEFIYLRDFFGTRMNTIFKFYYQVWILLGIAADYFLARLHQIVTNGVKRLIFIPIMVLVLCSLVYPFWGILTRLETLQQKAISEGGLQHLTLNGAEFLERSRPNDWAGITWLQKAEFGVVVEKVGASYTSDNSVSTFSGLPAILGPTNHESQWRGGYIEIGNREDEVRQIYESRSWENTKLLLEKYDVSYIFIGSAERSAYEIQEKKFMNHLNLVFESGDCRIYRVSN